MDPVKEVELSSPAFKANPYPFYGRCARKRRCAS